MLHLWQTQWEDNICNVFTLLSSLRLIMVASNTAPFLRTEELFKPLNCQSLPVVVLPSRRFKSPHIGRKPNPNPRGQREGPPGGGGDHLPSGRLPAQRAPQRPPARPVPQPHNTAGLAACRRRGDAPPPKLYCLFFPFLPPPSFFFGGKKVGGAQFPTCQQQIKKWGGTSSVTAYVD